MFRFPPLTPGVKRLLIAIGLIFVLQLAVALALGLDNPQAWDRLVLQPLALSLDGILRGFVWQPFTYLFLHDINGWGHLLMNGLALYLIGAPLEDRVGTRPFMGLALRAGLAGAAAVLLVQAVGALTGGWGATSVVGASGAIAGLLGAVCALNWDRWLYVFFIRLRGKHLLLVILAIELAQALSLVLGRSNVAVPAHLGGLAFGVAWGLGRWPPGAALRRWRRRRAASKPAPTLTVLPGGKSPQGGPTLH